MKQRFFLFLLATILLFAQIGCQPSEKEKILVDIPKGFSAGFARVDITPKLYPVSMTSSRKATSANDNLYATCVAIADGDEVALFIHLDLKRMNTDVFEETTRIIEEETGITADHVFLTATHTHNGPEINLDGSDGFVSMWMN